MFWSIIGIGVFIYGLVFTTATIFTDCDLALAFFEKFGKSVRRMKGKVVFITGASSGIGEHTAVAFAKHGVKLVLAARRKDELERVKRTCLAVSNGSLTDPDILILTFDMMDISSHQRAFDTAVQHFGGRVDVLFNNAGRSQRAQWENIDLSVDREMFELNVFSVVNLSRVAMHHFATQGEGHLAVTSSVAGVFGAPMSGTYTGSKHAIHGYFNSLRNEQLGKHITVSIFCPGPTATNFLQECYTEKPGEKYGIPVQPTDKRMTGERCGELCAVGIVNKVPEGWMGRFPIIPFLYIAVYFPIVFNFALKILGPERLFKFREGRQAQSLTEVQVQTV